MPAIRVFVFKPEGEDHRFGRIAFERGESGEVGELQRVPLLGELVKLEDGVVYRVTSVLHCPFEHKHDAEVYLEEVPPEHLLGIWYDAR